MTTTPPDGPGTYDNLTPEQWAELSPPTEWEPPGYVLANAGYKLGQAHERQRPRCIIDGRPATTEWPEGIMLENGEKRPAPLCQACYERCQEIGLDEAWP